MAQSISLLFVFSVFVEGFVEYFISSPDRKQPWLKYAACLIGIVVCASYKLDLFAQFGAVSQIPYLGSIMTGAIIGRGSNYLNDFVSTFKSSTVAITSTQPDVAPIQTTVQL